METLHVVSKNITLSSVIEIEETIHYYPDRTNNKTIMKQKARISSVSGMQIIRNQLENFGINRFKMNASKGRLALEQVLDKLNVRSHLQE